MSQLLSDAQGDPDEVVRQVTAELREVLVRKRADVTWKLKSVREAFEREQRLGLGVAEEF